MWLPHHTDVTAFIAGSFVDGLVSVLQPLANRTWKSSESAECHASVDYFPTPKQVLYFYSMVVF